MKTFADYAIDLRGKTGTEVKLLCPQCSASRKKKNVPCLNVNTEKRAWHCWHCGWTGGLGVTGTQIAPTLTKHYRKPDYIANTTALPDKLLAWFEQRGITQGIIKRNLIGHTAAYFPQVEEERSCVAFPYLRGSEIINVKYRTHDKLFRLAGGAERVLYGLNDIGERLVWVEGEMDKLAVEQAGILSCVSVPDGAPAVDAKSYGNKFDFLNAPELEKVTQHVIAVDSDAPGRKLEDELIRRLGRDKCLIVRWPDDCKDANDVLRQYGRDGIAQCIDEAQPLPIEGSHDAAEFADAFDRYYREGMPKGSLTGWLNVDAHYTVLPGEWTLVTGIPGDGKSEWLDALMMNLARREGWAFAVYSPENQPTEYHLLKLAEKFVGKPFEPGPTERMNSVEKDGAMTFINQHFTFLLPEQPTLDKLLDTARRLVMRKGIRGLVMDPWNEIDHSRGGGLSETEYIGMALGRIRVFARNHGVHVWVVAHPTKLQKRDDGSYPVPTPYDCAGSANWRNKADNCIAIWRDRLNETREVEVHVQKVRKKFVGRQGVAILNWDRVTGCYHAPLYPHFEKRR